MRPLSAVGGIRERIAAAESRMGLGKPDDNLVMMKRAERIEGHFEIRHSRRAIQEPNDGD